MFKISSSLAEVKKVTLMSILFFNSTKVVSRIALEKEIRPITRSVTIIIKTEASVTVLSLQKLKKPVRKILFNFVQNICLLLIRNIYQFCHHGRLYHVLWLQHAALTNQLYPYCAWQVSRWYQDR